MPAAMKRPAAAGPAAKKAKTAVGPSPTQKVAEALQVADIPGSVKEMFVSMMPFAFDTPRDAMQEQILGMISAELGSMETALKATVAEKERLIVTVGEERSTLETAIAQAIGKVEDLTTELSNVTSSRNSAQEVLKEANKALSSAQTNCEALDLLIAKAGETKMELELAISERAEFDSLDGETPAKDRQGKAQAFKAKVEGLFEDKNMLNALALSLSKPAASRGVFDDMVLRQFSEECNKLMTSSENYIADGDNRKAKSQENITVCEKQVETASSREEVAEALLKGTAASKKEADGTLKSAKAQLKTFEQDAKQRGSALAEAQGALKEFRDGPLAAFNELKDPPVAAEDAVLPEISF